MRVLVTGCHGFLGHHVTALLLEHGHHVLGVDRPASEARSYKGDRIKYAKEFRDRYHFAEGDLSKWAFTSGIFRNSRIDAVFHAAGQYSISYKTENLKHYIHGNLQAPVLVLEAAAIAKVPRFVYASSQSISDARRPSGLYGASKAFGEEALAAYTHRYPMTGIALRYGVLYGPMIRRDTDFYRTVNDHLAGREAKAGSQWDKRTPLIEIRDAAEIAVRAIEAKTDGMITMPAVANDGPRSYREVLECAALMNGEPLRVGQCPPAPQRFAGRPPDLSTTMRTLGWVPEITLEEGMGNYLRWARTAIT